ncbi:DHH family phosphoesterase [Halorientalis marina]|uniref:DHH family phosphoesterase n=1 Tax=Halorientalis marina TaxID=2931976 RepID=UPI001FF411E2|nr:bifunctional oligoribonuclease/PAP phosphatase NrnA [Halorientalis marina]
MHSRLVVGCGSVGHTLVDRLGERPGDLLVLERDRRRVERFREEGVDAKHVSTVDVGTVGSHATAVDTAVAAADDPAANLDAARALREAFPDAMLLVYAGFDADAATVAELDQLADRLVDPEATTAERLLDRIGSGGTGLRQLRRILRAVEEPLAIVAHDNPDPDAIASAVALRQLADAFGIASEVCYYGRITHQENRAFVNLLGFDLTRFDDDADLGDYGAFALVDHSQPGVNNQLPVDTTVDIVVDHHPPRAPIDARFVDLRSDVGATSTLMAEYLRKFDITPTEAVATGLLFGIRVDTNDFTRETSVEDLEAAAYLLQWADVNALERIESPSISGETFEVIAAAIRNREQRGSVVTTYVGEVTDRDALAQAADRLLAMEGVSTTVVYGVMEGTIYVSGRARGTDLDLGETLRDAFDQIGSAGGHADMAGAQIQMADTTLDPEAARGATTAEDEASDAADIETPVDDPEADGDLPVEGDASGGVSEVDFATEIESFVNGRLFEALESRPRRERVGLYASSEPPTDETDW